MGFKVLVEWHERLFLDLNFIQNTGRDALIVVPMPQFDVAAEGLVELLGGLVCEPVVLREGIQHLIVEREKESREPLVLILDLALERFKVLLMLQEGLGLFFACFLPRCVCRAGKLHSEFTACADALDAPDHGGVEVGHLLPSELETLLLAELAQCESEARASTEKGGQQREEGGEDDLGKIDKLKCEPGLFRR